MERLRQVYAMIGRQLGQLGPSQKLLIGSLLVIVLMTLFLVSQYAGAAKYVDILAGATPEEQNRAFTYLVGVGIKAEMQNGQVVVPAERQHVAIAQLAQAKALPADKELTFRNLVEKQNMFMPKGQLDQMFTTALTNELAQTISEFDGIESARVFISAPQSTGLGVAARKPVAQVTVFTGAGRGGTGGLDQKTVDALADVVAGAVAGLDVRNVAIIDGTSRRRYRATSPEDSAGQSYLEQAIAVEDRVRQKIEDHLASFIPGVVVSVNAMVDASKRERVTDKGLEKGAGTVAVTSRENTSTSTSATGSRAGEPGLAPNVGLDVNSGGGAGNNNTNTETNEVDSTVKIGSEVTKQVDARGRPTKINVTVSVPRGYVVEILKERAAGAGGATGGAGGGAAASSAGPADADVEKEWQTQQTRLVEMIRPLIDTKDVATTMAEAGDVVVSLMPMAITGGIGDGGGRAGLGGSLSGGGGGGGGMISALLNQGLIKQAALGALAVIALGMTFMLVKKAGKAQPLPTAEELVGIPPALQPDSDLVGEADESDTAMTGIEVDSDALKTGKMLEEVQELVKKNPQQAASVFTRWLAIEE